MTLAILQAAKAVQASLSGPMEARHGLSLSEIDVLANLSVAPEGALRMSLISDALVTNRPAVTRLVDGLEAKGLVERRALPGDRRAVKAAITDAGRARFREVCPFLEEELRHKLGDVLGDEETAALRSSLAAILSRSGRRPWALCASPRPCLGCADGSRIRGLRRSRGRHTPTTTDLPTVRSERRAGRGREVVLPLPAGANSVERPCGDAQPRGAPAASTRLARPVTHRVQTFRRMPAHPASVEYRYKPIAGKPTEGASDAKR